LDRASVRMKEAAEQAATTLDSDPMISTLKELAALRNRHVEALIAANKAGLNAVSAADIDDAKAKVLEAKIQLLSLESKRHPTISSEQLDSLRNEQTRLAIDRSETQARLEYLEKEIQEAMGRIRLRADLDQQFKQTEEKLSSEQSRLHQADAQINELEEVK